MTSLLGGVGNRNTMKEVFLLLLLSYGLVNRVVGLGPQCKSDQNGLNWKKARFKINQEFC